MWIRDMWPTLYKPILIAQNQPEKQKHKHLVIYLQLCWHPRVPGCGYWDIPLPQLPRRLWASCLWVLAKYLLLFLYIMLIVFQWRRSETCIDMTIQNVMTEASKWVTLTALFSYSCSNYLCSHQAVQTGTAMFIQELKNRAFARYSGLFLNCAIS
jgi:hypothetical protein